MEKGSINLDLDVKVTNMCLDCGHTMEKMSLCLNCRSTNLEYGVEVELYNICVAFGVLNLAIHQFKYVRVKNSLLSINVIMEKVLKDFISKYEDGDETILDIVKERKLEPIMKSLMNSKSTEEFIKGVEGENKSFEVDFINTEKSIEECNKLKKIFCQSPSSAHEFSVETLHHFKCFNETCNKWWSVGDWTPTDLITCPHCKSTGKLKPAKPLEGG